MSTDAAYEAGIVPPETLGWRMQRALSFAGVSVDQMSEELGVSRSTVSRWLNDRGTPSLGYLKIWALRTGTPYTWLRNGIERPVPDDFGPPADYTLTNVDKPSGLYATADEPISTEEIMRFRKRIPPKPRPVDVVDTRMAAIS